MIERIGFTRRFVIDDDRPRCVCRYDRTGHLRTSTLQLVRPGAPLLSRSVDLRKRGVAAPTKPARLHFAEHQVCAVSLPTSACRYGSLPAAPISQRPHRTLITRCSWSKTATPHIERIHCWKRFCLIPLKRCLGNSSPATHPENECDNDAQLLQNRFSKLATNDEG